MPPCIPCCVWVGNRIAATCLRTNCTALFAALLLLISLRAIASDCNSSQGRLDLSAAGEIAEQTLTKALVARQQHMDYHLSVRMFCTTDPLKCSSRPGVASLRAGLLDDIGKMASQLGASGPPGPIGPALFSDSDSGPSWLDLRSEALATPTGLKIEENKALWEIGDGPPHTDAKLRLFGSTGEPRVIFYRDTAAWCPYCQKVWMMLEEKRIPYRVEKINMRSYGEKPSWYLAKVPSGLLPAISLDGQLMTESLSIMQTLEAAFPETQRMLPDRDSQGFEEANRLLNLERELFRWWCQFVFRSGETSRGGLERVLDEVNAALASSPGPWFLPSSESQEGFSLVDLTYVPHLERMAASCPYWKGLQLRGNDRWPAINLWFEALELRPTYMATKSDFYTHVSAYMYVRRFVWKL